jgi:5-methylcytosine-specific restriction endonuclease McrA
MSAPPELKLLRSIKTGKGLIKLVNNLKHNRRINKVNGVKRSALTKKQRVTVLAKTDGHCHICGIKLESEWQADHVKSHSAGGVHAENNYLPSCFTCNNYRWHYTPEEILIILKLGVWAKTKVTNDPEFGLQIANSFVKYELGVRKRRRTKQKNTE